jgi:hypothetical protein
MRLFRNVGMLSVIAFGCNHPASSGGGSADAVSDAAAPHPSSASPSSSGAAHASREAGAGRVPAPCRVTGVEGTVSATPIDAPPDASVGAGLTIRPSADLPDDLWVDVGKASKFSTRDATSTREAMYYGPGRFYACIGHREDAWVESGTFESIGGAGERPGGEQWVTTPLGAARYDVAKWRITATEKTVEVKVGSGTGYFWPSAEVTVKTYSEAGAPPAVNDQGWVRLDGATGATFTSTKAVLNAGGTATALSQCFSLAAQARGLAESLAQPNADVGEIGPKHVVVRRQARAACGVGALRVAALPASRLRDELTRKLRTADAQWKSLGGDDGVGPGAGPIP